MVVAMRLLAIASHFRKFSGGYTGILELCFIVKYIQRNGV